MDGWMEGGEAQVDVDVDVDVRHEEASRSTLYI